MELPVRDSSKTSGTEAGLQTSDRNNSQVDSTGSVEDDDQPGARGNIAHGSDEVSDIRPCKHSHGWEGAAGFCVDCASYLCSKCHGHHRRDKETRGHFLLTGKDIPQTWPPARKQCAEHDGLSIKYYCQTEGEFGCLRCFAADHKQCNVKHISSMPMISKSLNKLSNLEASTKLNLKEMERQISVLSELNNIDNVRYERFVEDVNSHREDIKSGFDAIVELLICESEGLKHENTEKLNKHSELLSQITQETQSHLSEIRFLQKTKQNKKLLMALKKTNDYIQANIQSISQGSNLNLKRYCLEKGQPVQQILDKKVKAGALKVSNVLTCTGSINVKSPEDKKRSRFISGFVKISPTHMVVADSDNECLKLVAVYNNAIVYRRQVRSFPFAITSIPGASIIAVTLPNLNQIQFYDTNTELTPLETVRVDGMCYDVVSDGNILVVSYCEPGKVQIMDLHGNVMNTFTTDAAGDDLFQTPYYICLSPDSNIIYVSDDEKHTVTSLGTDGTVHWQYKADDLNPRGVATREDGCLYICFFSTDSIHEVSPRGVRLAVISTRQFSLKNSEFLYYSKVEGALYVSSAFDSSDDSDIIKRLSYM